MTTTTIQKLIADSADLKLAVSKDREITERIAEIAESLQKSLSQGGTIYACGNGGSACDAIHLVEELVARFKRERKGYRAKHFMDPGVLTCWSNDYEYTTAFQREVETFCTPKDILIGITTSGNSENICVAFEAAKQIGTKTIGLLGKSGGKAKDICDLPLVIPSETTERIQEVHILVIHILCELLETDYIPT